uniref:Uncharacterized protein n=1 Tax=Anguilla anguilla TaxID=7936 RepID=A0A0E9XHL5_ANGAN
MTFLITHGMFNITYGSIFYNNTQIKYISNTPVKFSISCGEQWWCLLHHLFRTSLPPASFS